jgi:hypothetical protein
MKPLLTLLATVLLAPLAASGKDADRASAKVGASSAAEALPFDREVINRYSLDHLPRSLSIRQGKDVWLGYDLERGKLYKVWQAPAGKPGLTTVGFVTRSAGTAWFEDRSRETWQLRREGKTVPLKIRYLGCSQREGHIELTWELRHDGGARKLVERISTSAASGAERVVRELRAEALAAGEALLPPLPAREVWKLGGRSAAELAGREWHRLTLP